MKSIGNLLWFLYGGLLSFLSWYFIGFLWCITIVGIPIGRQCFKIGNFSLFPFGKKLEMENTNTSLIANLIWIIFGGIELAIVHLFIGIILMLSIIGIPFGRQHFKLARLSLAPFAVRIYE